MSNFYSQIPSSKLSNDNIQRSSIESQRQQQQPSSLNTIPLPLLAQLPIAQQQQIQLQNAQQQQYQQRQQQQNQQQFRQQHQQHQQGRMNNYPKLQRDNLNMPNCSNLDQPVASYDYMPGTASLIEYIDKQLMVILRDGRTLIGYLRSIDQFANLLLSNTIERIHVGTKYGDIPQGIYMIRGENVVLLGEVDFNIPLKVSMERVGVEEILDLQRIEKKKLEESEKIKKKSLIERCLLPHSDAIDEFY